MRGRDLRAIANLCEQADDKADAVLLGSYKLAIYTIRRGEGK